MWRLTRCGWGRPEARDEQEEEGEEDVAGEIVGGGGEGMIGNQGLFGINMMAS